MKMIHCLWSQSFSCFVSNIAACIFVLKGCEHIIIFINVTYIYMLHICIYKIYNIISLLSTIVKFHIRIFVWNQSSSLLKGFHDFYFELMNVLIISLSCLLHNDFHSSLFIYSCMLRGGVGHVSCLNINSNSLFHICN